MARTSKPRYVTHREVMRRELKDPEFRYQYEQRLLVQELALVVRSLRKAHGLTQDALARRVHVSQPMIARVEKGIGQTQPNWQLFHRIAAALGAQLKLSLTSGPRREDESLVELDGRPAHSLTGSRADRT